MFISEKTKKKINSYGFTTNKDKYKKLSKNKDFFNKLSNSLKLLNFKLPVFLDSIVFVNHNVVKIEELANELIYTHSTYNKGFKNFGNKTYPAPKFQDILKQHYLRRYNSPRKNTKFKEELNNNYSLLTGTWSYPETEYTNNLYFDIDNENGFNILLKIIKKYHLPKPFLLEMSINGHIHVCFTLNKFFKSPFLKNLKIDRILSKEFNCLIELRTDTKPMRLPQSHSYKTGYISGNTFIPYKSNEHWIYKVEKQKHNDKLKLNFDNFFKKLIKNNEINEKDIKINEKNLEPTIPVFIRKYNLNKTNFKSVQIKSNFFYKFRYNGGERYTSIPKIVNYGISQGYNFETILKGTMTNANNSKTIKTNTKQHIYEVKQFYNKAIKNFNFFNKYDNFNKKSFYSNLKHIPDNMYIKNLILDIDSSLWNNLKKNNLFKKDNKWRQQYQKYSLILIKEIFGYYFFDLKFKRYKNPENRINNNIFDNLIKGFQISETYLNLLKEHYNIKINILNLFKLIIKYSNLLFLLNKNYSYNNKYKYCMTYNLNNIILYYINNIINNSNIKENILLLYRYYMYEVLKQERIKRYEKGIKINNSS